MQTLRDYQVTALESLRAAFRSGKRRVVLIAPTGSGKTTVAAHMVLGAYGRVLFVAHRKELIDQAHARLLEHGCESGIIMAGHERTAHRVQVASIQTLIRREFPPAELVIIDECHHAAADSYKRLFDFYHCPFVGLTATPWRTDGRGLKELFDDVVVASTPSKLIEQGHLVRYDGFKYEVPNLDGIRTVGGDYEQRALGLACSSTKVIGDIVAQWKAHASDLQTILFAVNIEHSKMLAEAFADVSGETIDHHMSKSERESVLARVRSGETRIICNVGILGEGVDIPDLECAILARPTKSLSLYLQQVGRVMRPALGKLSARIHDHGGNVNRHGLPDLDRDYSLEATRKTQPKVDGSLRTCPDCFAIFSTAPVCPVCGYVFEVEKRVIAQVGGVAVPLKIEWTRKQQVDWFAGELNLARMRGLKPGFAVHRFTDKFPGASIPWGRWRDYVDKDTKTWRINSSTTSSSPSEPSA